LRLLVSIWLDWRQQRSERFFRLIRVIRCEKMERWLRSPVVLCSLCRCEIFIHSTASRFVLLHQRRRNSSLFWPWWLLVDSRTRRLGLGRSWFGLEPTGFELIITWK